MLGTRSTSGIFEPEIKRELESELAFAHLQVEVKQLAHLFARRIGRPLTSAEREVLTIRMREQGFERVGDLVIDLSAIELSAWLQGNDASPSSPLIYLLTPEIVGRHRSKY